MTNQPFYQVVVSQLKPAASREEFLDLHRQTADWMRANETCATTPVANGMHRIIDSCNSFFGEQVHFE